MCLDYRKTHSNKHTCFKRLNTMIWTLLKSLLTGGIGKFADTYRDVKIAKIKNNTHLNNVVKDLEIKRLENEKAASQNAKEIRTATKDNWEMRLAVALVAIPTSFHYAATVLDHTYGFGWNVKPLPEPLDEWQAKIILSFFGLTIARVGINTVAAFLLKKK